MGDIQDAFPSFPMPNVTADHLPLAYALIGLGALIVVKKPSLVVNALSAYFLWQTAIQKGKTALNLP